MLRGLRRWFSSTPGGDRAEPGPWAEVTEWARQGGHRLRTVQDAGFVVDARHGGAPWRLEWGPAQRDYISGNELRLRAEVPLPPALQMLLLNRRLQESMEKSVFEQYVQDVQTRADAQSPPEMRWLVMHPRLDAESLGALRANFVAVASSAAWMSAWLQGPLSRALMAAPLDASVPVVLMAGRGRLVLRTAMPEPDLPDLKSWLAVFQTAWAEAARVAQQPPPAPPPLARDTSAPSAWAATDVPGADTQV